MSELNKIPKGDDLHATVKAGLGSISVLGLAGAELVGFVVTPPLDRRRQEWMNEIAERLILLEECNRVNFSSLLQNDQFLDTKMQATTIAL